MKYFVLILLLTAGSVFAQNADAYTTSYKTSQEIDNYSYEKTTQAKRVVLVESIADSANIYSKIGLSVAATDSATFTFYPKKITIANDSYSDTLYYGTSRTFASASTFKLNPRENIAINKTWRKVYFKFGYTATANVPYRFLGE